MHEAEVGFAIKTGLVGKLSDLIKGIDLLITLKLPLSRSQHTTIVSAYAFTMTSRMKSKLRNYRFHKTHRDATSSVSSTTDYYNISMTRIRDLLDSWLRNKAEEIQSLEQWHEVVP